MKPPFSAEAFFAEGARNDAGGYDLWARNDEGHLTLSAKAEVQGQGSWMMPERHPDFRFWVDANDEAKPARVAELPGATIREVWRHHGNPSRPKISSHRRKNSMKRRHAAILAAGMVRYSEPFLNQAAICTE